MSLGGIDCAPTDSRLIFRRLFHHRIEVSRVEGAPASIRARAGLTLVFQISISPAPPKG